MNGAKTLRTLMVIVPALLLVACFEDSVTTQQTDSQGNPIYNTPVQSIASCSMVQVANDIQIFCDGKLAGTLTSGTDGKDGTSCSTEPIPDGSGAYIICDYSVTAIFNGANGKNGIDGINGKDGINGTSCSALPTEYNNGFYLICGDQVIGAILNGVNGTNGIDGKDGINGVDGADGESCSVTEATNGVEITCGRKIINLYNGSNGSSCHAVAQDSSSGYNLYCADTLVGPIYNGKDGKDGKDGTNGKDGTSCYASALDDGSGFNLYCGDSLVGTIYNGKDGANGSNGTNGTNGKDGKNGEGCSITGYGDNMVQFSCGDDTVSLTNMIPGEPGKDGKDGEDGVNGSNGKDGADGKDGASCTIGSATDTTVTFICGKDTTTIKASVTINNTYNNGNLESSTFDPIVIYVPKDTASSSSSKAPDVIINSSASFDYTVEMGAVTAKSCNASPNSTIYRGDSVYWHLYTSDSSTVTDILNSIYEWKFPGGQTASYTAKGSDGLTTPKVVYDSIGYFYANVSINGSYRNNCGSVRVLPSLIRNCACREDNSYDNTDTTRWVLSGCSSYAPITQYEWDGVSETSEDGLIAYTPKSYNGQTKVTVTNSDKTTKEIACGYVLDNTEGFIFTTPGTYYLTYSCADAGRLYVTFSGTADSSSASWITNYNSRKIESYSNISYSTLFNSNSNIDASGSPIAFIVESGTWRVFCDY
ncbi:MAG: collagen-like protein [Fibrobacter sp.]|nr:collagen-like protein [Fibrobacter sp.]